MISSVPLSKFHRVPHLWNENGESMDLKRSCGEYLGKCLEGPGWAPGGDLLKGNCCYYCCACCSPTWILERSVFLKPLCFCWCGPTADHITVATEDSSLSLPQYPHSVKSSGVLEIWPVMPMETFWAWSTWLRKRNVGRAGVSGYPSTQVAGLHTWAGSVHTVTPRWWVNWTLGKFRQEQNPPLPWWFRAVVWGCRLSWGPGAHVEPGLCHLLGRGVQQGHFNGHCGKGSVYKFWICSLVAQRFLIFSQRAVGVAHWNGSLFARNQMLKQQKDLPPMRMTFSCLVCSFGISLFGVVCSSLFKG